MTNQTAPSLGVRLASFFGPVRLYRRFSMSSAATFYAALQVIAALLIYVAVYLALVLCTITCLVGAELISEHASVIRDYGVKPVSLDTHILSETDGETHGSSRQHVVSPLSDGSKDATRLSTLVLVRRQGRQRIEVRHG
jgi:hypothetical protein